MRAKALFVAVLVAAAAPVGAQPIHGHPQIKFYPSPAFYRPFDAQGHWLIKNGQLVLDADGHPVPVIVTDEAQALLDPNIAHLHVKITSSMYGSFVPGDLILATGSVLLHHFPGRVIEDVVMGWVGNDFGLANAVVWDATGTAQRPEMIGDPTSDKEWTFRFTLPVHDKLPPGWWNYHVNVNAKFDNGDGLRVRNSMPVWLDLPGASEFSNKPVVSARVTSTSALHPDHVWAETIAEYVTMLPLAPISVPWSVGVDGYQYGIQKVFTGGILQGRVDLDLHHLNKGTQLFAIEGSAGVLTFDPAIGAGDHKYALIWTQPIEEEFTSALAVFTVTMDPNAPPVRSPFDAPPTPTPPPPPPPPPPPLPSTLLLPLTILTCDSSTPKNCFTVVVPK